MKGDFSRLDFNAHAAYASVLTQQGRVQLDSDWNEQAWLLQHQREQLLQDLLGRSAAPRDHAGFRLIARGGLSFQADGQYVEVAPSAELSLAGASSFTIEVFLHARAGGRGGVLVSKSRASAHHRSSEYLLALQEDGRLVFARTERELIREDILRIDIEPDEIIETEEEAVAVRETHRRVVSTGRVPFGRTVHVAAVCRGHEHGSEVLLFVQGRLVGQSESGCHAQRVKAPLWLGATRGAHGEALESFDGDLLEVRLWRAARHARELRAGLNARLRGTEPDLIAAWAFDEGAGETAAAFGPVPHPASLGGGDPAARPAWRPLQFSLTPGRCYVEGLCCENEHELPLQEVPGMEKALPDVFEERTSYLLFLDVWPRVVTALEDPSLREVALGGADTAARLRHMWQVRLLPLEQARSWMQTSPAQPMLSAHCQPSGYALENTLYRVEIHDAGYLRGSPWSAGEWIAVEKLMAGTERVMLREWTLVPHRWAVGQYVEIAPCDQPAGDHTLPPLFRVTALDEPARTLGLQRIAGHWPAAGKLRLRPVFTFKWSRDNGGTALAVASSEGDTVLLRDPTGRAAEFLPNDWVEFSDEQCVVQNSPHALAQVETCDASEPSAPRLNLRDSPAPGLEVSTARRPLVRRWDAPPGDLKSGVCVPAAEGLVLEKGIEVKFHGSGHLQSGDYWLLPARSETGALEWPADAHGPRALPPHGIQHRYASLAIIRREHQQLHLEDLRHLFAPLGARLGPEQIQDHAITPEKLAPEVWAEIRRLIHEARHHSENL